MEARVGRLVASLREFDEVIKELQTELQTRQAAVDRLRAEEEQSRQLAAVKAEEAAAVRSLIDGAIGRAHAELQVRPADEQAVLKGRLSVLQEELETARSKGRREQALFFLSGALVSIPIGFMVNYFS
ncbi:hypothetical protein [Micromonospora endolithica]|uniref:Uncharacterized protein n=1 Tax=Micromonospora endolithica TaxID=230091 RepID=A0A3A9Z7K0_9ACTN|nr:hypothetical protein [Micromonospora endolithica]RKN44315.1 hypothetical protein D7223_18790 [Micromonospora endolithica]TWJ25795.1 hypothetical protein JD76_05969 [Micromonospora endolithica]